MLLVQHQLKIKILFRNQLPPFAKEVRGIWIFFCSVIARSVLCDVSISSTTLRHCEERPMRRGNLILLKFLLKKELKKMRSSRLQKTKPQDDGCGVRWDPHAGKHLSGWLMKGTLPPQSGTPLRRGIERLIPPLRGNSFKDINRVDSTFLIAVEDENTIQKSISPLEKGGKGDLYLSLFRHCEERPMRRGNLI